MLILFRTATAAAAALTFLSVSAATVAPADAQVRRHGGNGAGIAAGVIGGLAAGAILGGALTGPRYTDPGYEGGEGPYTDQGCPPVREPVYDRAGQFAGYRTAPSC